MNTVIRTSLAFAAISLLPLSAPVCAQESQKSAQPLNEEKMSLQGIWEGTEIGEESKGKSTMTISGDMIHFDGATKEESYKARFELIPRKEPKQMKATITESSAEEFVGKSSIAIYKIEDGTLTLVGGKPGSSEVPKGFETGEGVRTFVFKKKGK